MRIRLRNGREMNASAEDVKKLRENNFKFEIVAPEFQCPYCDKMFKKEVSLIAHTRSCKAPLISVIIPRRPNEEFESVKSIKAQTYKNIEIIKITDKDLKGASWARNQGLKKAKGEYIFFCDNDVELVPDCLEALYRKLRNSEASWCFGKISIDGENTPPKGATPKNKKSESYLMYFEHISTMSLIDAKAKPRWDESFRRFDDWDLWMDLDGRGHSGLFLDKVILYTKQKPNGVSMQDDAEEALEKLRKKYGIGQKIADIVIPHHNRHDHLHNCLDRLDNSIFNIIIVSGGTFSQNCNKGARLAETEDIIFLNDDALPDNDILAEMAQNPADIVGVAQTIPKISKDLIFYGIGYEEVGDTLVAGLSRTPEETHIPSGYCFKVKKKVWKEMGGLDEIYKNGAEDQDFGFRALEAGYKIDYLKTPMPHMEAQSEGRHKFAGENDRIFRKKWTQKRLRKLI